MILFILFTLQYIQYAFYLLVNFYIIDWLKDKKTSWVLAGISSAYTKMDLEIWNISRNNTNVNESAHYNINLDGTSLSLLAAIKK